MYSVNIFTDVQIRLMKDTLKHPKGFMLGAPEILQLNSNIMQTIRAKKVLDIGVFTGASALAAALALPPDHGGQVHGLDNNEEYTNMAKKYWSEAGVSDKIHLHIGDATDTLQKFIDEGQAGSYDFAFVDADKNDYNRYFEQCLVLVRSGGIISFDNTLWRGSVLDPQNQSDFTVAVREFNLKVKDDKRVNISFLKIGDGLTICFKK
ncbi:caffeoyl-CoA O-methyltransferase 2-like 1 [Homarus americanus]|uniref:Caffeoyl-CoA O-methyltransferase 2-like 1 n=1 Tax=Homarus americanus TaxID=6706 RepID=A0A8J5TDT4_HOMAM|nr:caffeoyl-CoA O-methyltransferase 2-like 1 [Homarus americanus]